MKSRKYEVCPSPEGDSPLLRRKSRRPWRVCEQFEERKKLGGAKCGGTDNNDQLRHEKFLPSRAVLKDAIDPDTAYDHPGENAKLGHSGEQLECGDEGCQDQRAHTRDLIPPATRPSALHCQENPRE